MRIAHITQTLRADLAAVAGLGDAQMVEAADKLSAALQSSIGLRLLDALTEAARELGDQLPGGHVEVRLVGQDAELVYVGDESRPGPAQDDAFTARITLRLPEALKARIEAAASREGVSANTWIVRALTRAASSAARSDNRLTGFGRS